MIYVILGVSGVGKSTTGRMLAKQLQVPFYDADDYHPQSNVEKMKNGVALNDADRLPWLKELAQQMIGWNANGGAVLACSALKESYRKTLQVIDENELTFILLNADFKVVLERLHKRVDHFMGASLLTSQFETLDIPAYGIHINVNKKKEAILKEIMEKLNRKSTFGIIGLGVMGKSLALNIAGKKVDLSVYNRQIPEKEVDVAKQFVEEHQEAKILGFDDLEAFVQSLEKPRNILLMVNAGKAVDLVIDELLPLLTEDDLIIDGGNSHFEDTKRRIGFLTSKGINFIGTGVSGGEEGALKGPSIMPGGPQKAYRRVASILESIAAKDKMGKPCCTYIGPSGSGHFVKMIHNGIEYAEMQIIAEVNQLLRQHFEMTPDAIADVFTSWSGSGINSYLLEISIDILRAKEGESYVIDLILDKAGQKGTGGWSTNAALALGKPLNTISDAVMARCLSAMKDLRVEAAEVYQQRPSRIPDLDFNQLKNAYQAARIINHAIGFDVMQEASDEYNWELNFSEIARIWTNGCIIRSQFMEDLVEILKDNPPHLLLHPSIVENLKKTKSDYIDIVNVALKGECSIPVMSSGLNYFFGFTSAQSWANMIQAQRDFFGAHTFQRVDRPLGEFFHYDWKAS